ncbi:MAG: hypothetical protein GY865_14375 [candidate division Zixibacteria bacterium]|nr:hypothetical protein [candidate division Zixibacteria bacterium]
MSKKLILLIGVLFLFVAVGSAYAQTEDEVVASFMKKVEKKHKTKVGFFSTSFSYGLLNSDNGFNQFKDYANSRISPGYPVPGAYRSYQFNADFGMMLNPRVALKLGFDYWLKMGGDQTGDYTLSVEPLGLQTDINMKSEAQILGFSVGADYYLTNPPDKYGIIHGLAFKVGATGGFYMANWEVWEGMTSYNLATAAFESNSDPLKDNSLGFTVSGGIDYPTPIWDMLIGFTGEYQYLNFDNIKSYNTVGEELYLSASDAGTDQVSLDLSGFRAKIELKKFFSW